MVGTICVAGAAGVGAHHLGTQVLEPLVVHFFRDVPDEEAGRAAVHVGVLQLGVRSSIALSRFALSGLGHGIHAAELRSITPSFDCIGSNRKGQIMMRRGGRGSPVGS